MQKQQNQQDVLPLPILAAARRCRYTLFGGIGVLLPVALVAGCGSISRLHTPARYEHGYVIILPGIEGRSYLNVNIANGLVDGGVNAAIEIYDWTAGSLLLFPVTMRAESRNKRQALKIAQKIQTYQDRYPGRPVHLIGHSGGGGMAVLTLEALPSHRKIAGAILLAPAIAPNYDLTRALRRTEYGLYNYYSRHDVGFLTAGTMVVGTMDGQHTSAAGAVGFELPKGLDDDGLELYRTRLHQQRYTVKMADSSNYGGHFGWANRRFVAEWLAPVVRVQDTPGAADRPVENKAGSRPAGTNKNIGGQQLP